MEINKLVDLNNLRTAPQLSNSQVKKLLKELEAKRANGELKRGRPVNPNSVRQMEIERKKHNKIYGFETRGRKVDPNSARQIRLTELDNKRANGELKLGRPVNPNSARQVRLMELEQKRANGTLRRGRPAKKSNKLSIEKVGINGVDIIAL